MSPAQLNCSLGKCTSETSDPPSRIGWPWHVCSSGLEGLCAIALILIKIINNINVIQPLDSCPAVLCVSSFTKPYRPFPQNRVWSYREHRPEAVILADDPKPLQPAALGLCTFSSDYRCLGHRSLLTEYPLKILWCWDIMTRRINMMRHIGVCI